MKKKIEAKFICVGDKLFRKSKRYTLNVEKGQFDDIYVSLDNGQGKAYPSVLEFL